MTTLQNNKNTFFAAMDREVTDHKDPTCLGHNGATEHTMYGLAGDTNSHIQGALTAAYAGLTRGVSREKVQELFRNIEDTAKAEGDKALQNAMTSAFVIGFQKRDCRGGEGEKDLSRWWMLELWDRYPQSVQALAPLFPKYGYWKDMILYIQDIHTSQTKALPLNSNLRKYNNKTHPLSHTLYQIMVDQLKDDLAVYHAYQKLILNKSIQEKKLIPTPTISLLAKWIPKEGRSFDKKFYATKVLAQLFNPELYEENKYNALKQFRQQVSMLNQVINTTERLMSLNLWDQISWHLVPGKCLQKHRRAFLNLVGGSKCKTQDERSSSERRRQCRKNLMEHMELQCYVVYLLCWHIKRK